MDAMTETLRLWQDELVIVLGICAGVVVFHYASKSWKSGVSVTLVLGTGLALVGTLMYVSRRHWRLFMSDRAMLFSLLYVWSVLGLLFVAGRHTSPFKLFLGSVALAGVIYGVYKYI